MLTNKGPVFRVQKYESKKPWQKYGIPVEIDLEDDRGTAIGSFFPDFPGQALEYPYFALFLDPANALVLRGIDMPTSDVPLTSVFKTGVSLEKLPSKPILTSEGSKKRLSSLREYRDHQLICTSGVPSVRVGMATFSKTLGRNYGNKEDEKDRSEKKPIRMMPDGLSREEMLKRLAHVEGDGSWGPVTRNDPKILVRIF